MACEQWTVPAVPRECSRVRRAAVAFAAAQRVADPPINDLQLALSEAVANAATHAFTDRPEPGTVTVTVIVDEHDRQVCVRVNDDGHGIRPRHDSPGLGLGMPLITQLAEDVQIRVPPSGVGTEVAMVFRLDTPDVLE